MASVREVVSEMPRVFCKENCCKTTFALTMLVLGILFTYALATGDLVEGTDPTSVAIAVATEYALFLFIVSHMICGIRKGIVDKKGVAFTEGSKTLTELMGELTLVSQDQQRRFLHCLKTFLTQQGEGLKYYNDFREIRDFNKSSLDQLELSFNAFNLQFERFVVNTVGNLRLRKEHVEAIKESFLGTTAFKGAAQKLGT